MNTIAKDQRNVSLARLNEIREHLGQLRKDRTVYIRSEDVLTQYQLLCQQIQALSHLEEDDKEFSNLNKSMCETIETSIQLQKTFELTGFD